MWHAARKPAQRFRASATAMVRGGWRAAALIFLLALPATAAATSMREINALIAQIRQLEATGHYREGLPLAQRLVLLTRRRAGTRSNDYAAAVDVEARFLAHLGRYAEAAKAFEADLAATEASVGPDSPDVAMTLTNLANVYNILVEFPQATEAAQRAITIFERSRGPQSPELVTVLNTLGSSYEGEAKYEEAAAAFRRAIDITQKTSNNTGDISFPLNNLGVVLSEEGQFKAAIDTLNKALAATEKAYGPDHPEVAATLMNLAKVYQGEANYAQSEDLLQRALKIQRARFGDNHPDVVRTLLGVASTLDDECHIGEAETLFKEALATADENPTANKDNLPHALADLASIYLDQGRLSEAQGLADRALAQNEATYGRDHPSNAGYLERVANIDRLLGRTAEAEARLERARTLLLAAHGPDHPAFATILQYEGVIAESQHQFDAAEKDYRKVLAIEEKAYSTGNPRLIGSLRALGLLRAARGRIDAAKQNLKRALAIAQATLGARHPTTGYIFGDLGFVAARAGQWLEALNDFRQETALAGRTPCGAADPLRSDDGDRRFARGFRALVPAAWHVGIADPTQAASLEREAFIAAQNAQESEAAIALKQMAARFASGQSAMAHAVREEQDLKMQLRGLDKRLATELAAADDKRNERLIASLQQRTKESEAALAAVQVRIAKDFPQYAEVADPAALSIEAAQGLLAANEALVAFISLDHETFVFAVTKEASRWRQIDLTSDDLSARVKALRTELYDDTPQANGQPPYDLGAAYELYSLLFGKVEDLIAKKHEWLIIPDAALTSLPFHVLVTQKPDPSIAQADQLRQAAWLLRSHATTILPSVSSLRALRRYARASRATQPFIGFGDPTMHVPEPWAKPKRSRSWIANSAHRFFRGIDFSVLRNGLPPLPETAAELRAIAHALGAPESDAKLGDAATVTAVKTAPLDQFRIVDFATHGLLAGEAQGLSEPALVLSLPATLTAEDDGLLTASDVTGLKLDADWTVLSACNTAAGERPGAQGLSGLARAFFYAGARALLVSHWPVDSNAAVKLTTKTFAELAAHPAMSRAEALRQAMLALLDDRSAPSNADPSVWAPFVLVGDNRRPESTAAAVR